MKWLISVNETAKKAAATKPIPKRKACGGWRIAFAKFSPTFFTSLRKYQPAPMRAQTSSGCGKLVCLAHNLNGRDGNPIWVPSSPAEDKGKHSGYARTNAAKTKSDASTLSCGQRF